MLYFPVYSSVTRLEVKNLNLPCHAGILDVILMRNLYNEDVLYKDGKPVQNVSITHVTDRKQIVRVHY